MGSIASQITSLTIVYSSLYSGADQKNIKARSASLAFVRRIHRRSTWDQHGAYLGPVGPRWAPWWPHEPCYQGLLHAAGNWCHDNVIKWKHFPRNWPFVRGIHRSPVNSPHKGQWRGALMFSLICVWINGWVNNREAGDLRRYRAHYDVIVMASAFCLRLEFYNS